MPQFSRFQLILLLVTVGLLTTACIGLGPLPWKKSSDDLLRRTNVTNVKVRQSQVKLEFREQKPGVANQLAAEQRARQALLRQQAQRKQSGNPTAIAENKAALKRSDEVMIGFFGPAILTEKDLIEAYADTYADVSTIVVKFGPEGSQKFATVTKNLAGTGRCLGIFFDGRLLSTPIVAREYASTGITGGKAAISGSFSPQEALELAAKLRGDE